MITALCIIGYLVMIFVTAIVCNKMDMEKDDALALGIIWPVAIVLGICGLICMPLMYLGDKIVDLWDEWERKHGK